MVGSYSNTGISIEMLPNEIIWGCNVVFFSFLYFHFQTDTEKHKMRKYIRG